MTSNPEHDDSVARIFTCFVGKAEEVPVVPKIVSQVYCKGDVATQQTSYYASCHTDFI